MMALASALARDGWHCTPKPMTFRAFELLTHLSPLPGLYGIHKQGRAQFAPPWPDLVISAGRRTELVARWVKSQAPATKLIHLGRPWSNPKHFDLVVTTPQYSVPAAPGVLCNPFPLYVADHAKLAAAAEAWAPKLASFDPPRVVVLLGGNSGPYVFTPEFAETLAVQVNDFLVQKAGGSLLVTSSRRTPKSFIRAFASRLQHPNFLFDWHDESSNGADSNPYPGFLALGDEFIVTAESVSMTTEALATGKPVHLAAVPSGLKWSSLLHFNLSSLKQLGWKPVSHHLAMLLAPRRFRRNVRQFQDSLVTRGLAQWLGSKSKDPHKPACETELDIRKLIDEGLTQTVARIKQMTQLPGAMNPTDNDEKNSVT